jgi:hypothetical protein
MQAEASSLSYRFPRQLSAPNRIIRALARSGGEACLCSLRLRTALPPEEFNAALALLRRERRVDLINQPPLPGKHSHAAEKRVVLAGF